MGEITAHQENMIAPKIYLRSPPCDIEDLNRRVESTLSYIKETLQNVCDDLSTRGKNDVTKRELLSKLPEEHDRDCSEDRGSKAISADTGEDYETMGSRTERHVRSPSGDTPQRYFPDHSETLLTREEVENVLNTTTQHQTVAEWRNKCLCLTVDGRIGDKPCLVIVDTGATSTIVRPDIAVGLPARNLARATSLQSISGQLTPVLKQVLVRLTLHNCRITTWALVANITEEFLLGLDVMWDLGVALDLGRQVLRIAGQDVPLKRSEFYPYMTSNGEEPRRRS
jgi:predicted aspartyl protease